ncbi:MAG: hypothetical protein J6S44_02160, partial [Clostridia bacterium]|nr:hypothetical protein [Clostridia bacterium]
MGFRPCAWTEAFFACTKIGVRVKSGFFFGEARPFVFVLLSIFQKSKGFGMKITTKCLTITGQKFI